MSENIVYNMDCMEGMKEYPDKYFDLTVADPPYGINITGRHKAKGGASPVIGGGTDRSEAPKRSGGGV